MRRLILALAFLAAASAAGIPSIELPSPAVPVVEKAEEIPIIPTADVPVEAVIVAKTPEIPIVEEASSVPEAVAAEVAPTPVQVVDASVNAEEVASPSLEVEPVKVATSPQLSLETVAVEIPSSLDVVVVKTPEIPSESFLVAPTVVKIAESSIDPTSETVASPTEEVAPTAVKVAETPVGPTSETVASPTKEVAPTAIKVAESPVNPTSEKVASPTEEVAPTAVKVAETPVDPTSETVASPTEEIAPTAVKVAETPVDPNSETVASPTEEIAPTAVKVAESPVDPTSETVASPTEEVAPTAVKVAESPVDPTSKTVASPTEEVAPTAVKVAESAPENDVNTGRFVELEPTHYEPISDWQVMPRNAIGDQDKVITVQLGEQVDPSTLIDIRPVIISPEVMRQIAEIAAHDTEAVYIGDAHPFAYNAEPLEIEPVRVIESPVNGLSNQMDPLILIETAVNEESAPFHFAEHEFRPILREIPRVPQFSIRRPELPPHLAPFFETPYSAQPEDLRDFEFRGVRPEDLRGPMMPYEDMPQDPMLR